MLLVAFVFVGGNEVGHAGDVCVVVRGQRAVPPLPLPLLHPDYSLIPSVTQPLEGTMSQVIFLNIIFLSLLTSVADPDPGSGIRCLLIRDPGWVKSKDPGPESGMNNRKHIS